MGKTYLSHHWNQFDFLIVTVGIIDIVIMNVLKQISPGFYVLKIINIFRMFRLLRILRLLKVKVHVCHLQQYILVY